MAAIAEQEEVVSKEIERFLQSTSSLISRLRGAEREMKKSVEDVLKKVKQTKEDLIEGAIQNTMKQSLERFEEESARQAKEFENTLAVTLRSQRKIASNRRKQFEENLTRLQRRENKMIKDAIEDIEITIEKADAEVNIADKLINTVESITVSKCKSVLSDVLHASIEMKRVLSTISTQSQLPQESQFELERMVDNALKLVKLGETKSGVPLYFDLDSYSSDSDG